MKKKSRKKTHSSVAAFINIPAGEHAAASRRLLSLQEGVSLLTRETETQPRPANISDDTPSDLTGSTVFSSNVVHPSRDDVEDSSLINPEDTFPVLVSDATQDGPPVGVFDTTENTPLDPVV